ncbi:MAG: PAS domain S-box protein [Verrucomicrobia bacterium]|nr:PAS domain S-box protein [Verrucomicrobiota bacterium]
MRKPDANGSLTRGGFVNAVLDTVAALVVVRDRTGRIVKFNRACEGATGYGLAEVTGRPCWDVFLALEEAAAGEAAFQALITNPKPSEHTNFWRTKDGRHRRIHWSDTPVFGALGAVTHVVSTGIDVTQRCEAEDQLRILTRAIEAGPANVVITDAAGAIIYVNPTFVQLTGFTPGETMGHKPSLWKSGCHSVQHYQQLWAALSRGEEWRGEFCNRKKNGELYWIHSSISPVKNDDGAITHFVAVTVDITERKRSEQALKEAHENLERQVQVRTRELRASVEHLHAEVEARKTAEAALQARLGFERLIADLSAGFACSGGRSFEIALKEGLQRLADFVGADRAALIEFVGEEIRLSVHCEAEGVAPAADRLLRETLPWTWEQLRHGQAVSFARLGDLPAAAERDRQTFHQRGVRSLAGLPLVIGQEVIGALRFTTLRAERSWSFQTDTRLKVVEDLFANLLLRWRTEQALDEAERRYRAVAQFTRDWEYWQSPDGALRYCSPACERLTGYPAQQFLVQPGLIGGIVLPEDEPLWRAHRCVAFGEPALRVLQFRIRAAQGEVRWIEHTCQPIADEQGVFLGIRASNRDITAAKEAELETQRLREELTRITRVTTAGQLAASLAHELNQPLTAILSNAQAAQRFADHPSPDLDEVRAALHDIIQDDQRAAQVIQRLRALFRKDRPERAAVDLNRLIEETLALLRSELVLKGVRLHLDLAPTLPPVLGNRVELQQVLLNLTMNAVEAMTATEPGARSLGVTTARVEPARAQVSIRDTGPGLAAAHLERLFEPFFTTKAAGMGMGLPICRSIIEAHGGRLEAANHADGGALFGFTLLLIVGKKT